MNRLGSLGKAAVAVILALAGATSQSVSAAEPAPDLRHGQPIRHVFVIVLENEGFDVTFGPGSKAPYLAQTLTKRGALLAQYFGTTHFSLGNYLAMISGQPSTPQTRDDCEVYADFVATGTTPDGLAVGTGCVYPQGIKTLAHQLEARGYSWKAYEEDMGNDPQRESSTCAHPPLNAADPTQKAEAPSPRVPMGDQYATRHNPFMYFHSIIDRPNCAKHVVNLSHLSNDLADPAQTPNFAFITPNLCHDGHDAPCVTGEPGGLLSADAFLRHWVPRILASAAYRNAGMLLITFDESDVSEETDPAGGRIYRAAGASCCGQQPGPNIASFPQTINDAGDTELFLGFGGDRTGAVLLSPRVKPGSVSHTPFNHYSLLKTLEDVFATDGYLGYAGRAGLVGFFDAPGSDVRLVDVASGKGRDR